MFNFGENIILHYFLFCRPNIMPIGPKSSRLLYTCMDVQSTARTYVQHPVIHMHRCTVYSTYFQQTVIHNLQAWMYSKQAHTPQLHHLEVQSTGTYVTVTSHGSTVYRTYVTVTSHLCTVYRTYVQQPVIRAWMYSVQARTTQLHHMDVQSPGTYITVTHGCTVYRYVRHSYITNTVPALGKFSSNKLDIVNVV